MSELVTLTREWPGLGQAAFWLTVLTILAVLLVTVVRYVAIMYQGYPPTTPPWVELDRAKTEQYRQGVQSIMLRCSKECKHCGEWTLCADPTDIIREFAAGFPGKLPSTVTEEAKS